MSADTFTSCGVPAIDARRWGRAHYSTVARALMHIAVQYNMCCGHYRMLSELLANAELVS